MMARTREASMRPCVWVCLRCGATGGGAGWPARSRSRGRLRPSDLRGAPRSRSGTKLSASSPKFQLHVSSFVRARALCGVNDGRQLFVRTPESVGMNVSKMQKVTQGHPDRRTASSRCCVGRAHTLEFPRKGARKLRIVRQVLLQAPVLGRRPRVRRQQHHPERKSWGRALKYVPAGRATQASTA